MLHFPAAVSASALAGNSSRPVQGLRAVELISTVISCAYVHELQSMLEKLARSGPCVRVVPCPFESPSLAPDPCQRHRHSVPSDHCGGQLSGRCRRAGTLLSRSASDGGPDLVEIDSASAGLGGGTQEAFGPLVSSRGRHKLRRAARLQLSVLHCCGRGCC